MIYEGDSRDWLLALAIDGLQVDSIVTDPPYGLVSTVKRFGKVGSAPAKSDGATGVYKRASVGFMGQEWDGTGIEQDPEFWKLCYAVLKPGGHLLAFGGTRTFDLIAHAIRAAGFDLRDTVMWLYGTGFPKSHNVGRAIEAQMKTGGSGPKSMRQTAMGEDYRPHALAGTPGFGDGPTSTNGTFSLGAAGAADGKPERAEVSHPEAIPWEGWGTALKPAWEPVMVFRKPLEGTVAQNVQAHGTGAMNIDGCRVPLADGETPYSYPNGPGGSEPNHMQRGQRKGDGQEPKEGNDKGRWPANLVHDGSSEVTSAFPVAPGQQGASSTKAGRKTETVFGAWDREGEAMEPRGDVGTAARFFYSAKATKNDRMTCWRGLPIDVENRHPTVKPTELMRWLCRLVTPPGGLVLDPFAGSGSTGKAARMEGFRFIGVEADPVFASVAAARSGSDFRGLLRDNADALAENMEARRRASG